MIWERRQRPRSAEETQRNTVRRHCAEEIARQLLAINNGTSIDRITLFGSVAENRDTPESDVDLGIIVRGKLLEYEVDRLTKVYYDGVNEYAKKNIPTTHVPLHLTVVTREMYAFYLSIRSCVIGKIEKGIVLYP